MRLLKNNSINSILIVKGVSDLTTALIIRFKQLGSGSYRDIAISTVDNDCYTYSIEFYLSENNLSNGNYLIEFIDINNNVLETTTVNVSDFNEDDYRAYIVIDDVPLSDSIQQ